MPNHVATCLTITGGTESLEQFKATHIVKKEDEYTKKMFTCFDFNTIKPCHPDLHAAISPRRTGEDLRRAKERGDTEAQIREVMEQIKLGDENHKKFGYANWYDFCNNEWGTKWGAYDFNISDDQDEILSCSYSTAWSPATPILEKLAEMYPTLVFEQHVLDEGMGFGGTQRWDEDGYHETMHSDSELYEFCNDKFGNNYTQCDCGGWYESEWSEDGDDDTKCYDCNHCDDD